MAQSDRPLSKYALADALGDDQQVMRLVMDMLKATVASPQVHAAGFRADQKWDRSSGFRAGFDYFLGSSGGTSNFDNHRHLVRNITPALQEIGFVRPSTVPNIKSGFWQFTDEALAWYQENGGPSDDEVRTRIGRHLQQYIGKGFPPRYVVEKVAEAIQVPIERVRTETYMLRGAGLVFAEALGVGGDEFGMLGLSEPEGFRWAAAGFPPIGSIGSISANVAVDLRVEVRAIIEQARRVDTDPVVLEQFEARLRRVEEEIAKDDGDGNYEKVRDLIETANTSKDLFGSVIPFLIKHWDKILTFVDATGNALPGQ